MLVIFLKINIQLCFFLGKMRPLSPLLLLVMLPEMLLCLLLMVMTQPPPDPAHVPVLCLPTLFLFFFFFFFWVPNVFLGFFILLLEQYFYSNLRTMSLAQCFWAFNSIDYFMFTYLLSCLVVHDTFWLYVISIYFVVCLPVVQGFVCLGNDRHLSIVGQFSCDLSLT